VEDFPRPRVVVSRCLGSDRCRYDGGAVDDPFVKRLAGFADLVLVCPEAEIGLGTPRAALRLVEESGGVRLRQPASGKDLTGEMETFSEKFLDSLGEGGRSGHREAPRGEPPGGLRRGDTGKPGHPLAPGPDGFLLKNRSPTCGPADVAVYREPGKKGETRKGAGLFARAAAARYPDAPVTDEGRLKSFALREHFLTALFAVARFGEVKREGDAASLVRFHTVNKLLFMGYNQTAMRKLGRIVANPDREPVAAVISRYETLLAQALAKPPRFTSMINVLAHAFGGLSDRLGAGEKAFFLTSVEEYRKERIPLRALLATLEAWSVAQGNEYLLAQTFMRPYPRELADVADSGKKREG
jgi:uncharacterized protein YbgA (DUF1722 family)/uncharacterized protein YbbK (DUF523 family)